MNKFEEIVSATRLHDVLHKKDENKAKNTILWILAVVGAVAAIAGIVLNIIIPGNDYEFEGAAEKTTIEIEEGK